MLTAHFIKVKSALFMFFVDLNTDNCYPVHEQPPRLIIVLIILMFLLPKSNKKTF